MSNKYQVPRGTQDIMGDDISLWQQAEGIIREQCARYGYQEIRTPVFEHTEVFKFQNDSSDMVTKEMYTFLDSGESGDGKEKPAGADQPLVSAIIKKFGVDVNIISGKVDYLKDTPYGTLLVEIMGDEKSIGDSVQYAKDAGVKLEVIGYVG